MDILSQEAIMVTVASIFFVLLTVCVIIFFLVYKKRQLLHAIERKEMNNLFQNELLKTRLEAQEETLLKISKDLHDNIGQLLSSSKMLIGVAERSMLTSPDTLQLADETLSKAIHELRAMSRSLNKEWLDKFSLIENLEVETSRIKSSQEMDVVFVHPDKISLSGDRQLLLYRIAQEAFQNVISHAKASRIRVSISEVNSSLTLAIEDNGCGFAIADSAGRGHGITNIKHRTEVMGGQAQWYPSQKGTLVEIHLPIYEFAHEKN